MASPYVELRDGAWKIRGKRVSLDSVVVHHNAGYPPDLIRGRYPSLTLDEVEGAIAFYLANREEIDAYLAEVAQEIQRTVRPLSETNPALLERLVKAKDELGLRRG